jgi:hypothetical protein
VLLVQGSHTTHRAVIDEYGVVVERLVFKYLSIFQLLDYFLSTLIHAEIFTRGILIVYFEKVFTGGRRSLIFERDFEHSNVLVLESMSP